MVGTGGPVQRTSLPTESWGLVGWGPTKGAGMLVDMNQAVMSSHKVTASHWAEDKKRYGREAPGAGEMSRQEIRKRCQVRNRSVGQGAHGGGGEEEEGGGKRRR